MLQHALRNNVRSRIAANISVLRCLSRTSAGQLASKSSPSFAPIRYRHSDDDVRPVNHPERYATMYDRTSILKLIENIGSAQLVGHCR